MKCAKSWGTRAPIDCCKGSANCPNWVSSGARACTESIGICVLIEVSSSSSFSSGERLMTFKVTVLPAADIDGRGRSGSAHPVDDDAAVAIDAGQRTRFVVPIIHIGTGLGICGRKAGCKQNQREAESSHGTGPSP